MLGFVLCFGDIWGDVDVGAICLIFREDVDNGQCEQTVIDTREDGLQGVLLMEPAQ